jgi:hypothetical protein
MKFQVPQFIEMEDKIFGPLSFKEFAYVAGACGLSYVLYRYIPSFFIAALFIFPILTFGGLLAFYRPNNKPFIDMVQSAILYGIGRKLYIWKKEKKPLTTKEINLLPRQDSNIQLPTLSSNKLSSLNWNLDTQAGKEKNDTLDNGLNLKI